MRGLLRNPELHCLAPNCNDSKQWTDGVKPWRIRMAKTRAIMYQCPPNKHHLTQSHAECMLCQTGTSKENHKLCEGENHLRCRVQAEAEGRTKVRGISGVDASSTKRGREDETRADVPYLARQRQQQRHRRRGRHNGSSSPRGDEDDASSGEDAEATAALREQQAKMILDAPQDCVAFQLCAVSPFLTCPMCTNYLCEATTICECLHTCECRHLGQLASPMSRKIYVDFTFCRQMIDHRHVFCWQSAKRALDHI